MLLAVYRPGSYALSQLFFDELSAVFERLAAFGCPIVVCGDFNIHVDNTDDINSVRLCELLQSFDCVQHVAEPTHNAGHTLDLVITRSDTSISALRVGDMVSDHALVCFTLHVETEKSDTHHWIMRRAWRRLSSDAFASDLAASALCCDLTALEDKSVDDLAQLYSSELTRLLDRHCPVVKVRHKLKQTTPWFDADCRAARRRARAAERRFRRTYAKVDRLAWEQKLGTTHSLYERKSSNYWRDEIAASKGNTTRLWRTLHGVLGETTGDENCPHSAEDFASYFRDKVDAVRASTSTTPTYDVPCRATPTLEEWTLVSVDEVEQLISSALNKTCELDPAPTWLVKEMRGLLSPFITLLFNKSLMSACFPAAFKQALVRPSLKKVGLDAGDLKNFRPVSNLPFLAKLLERVVQVRLQGFLDTNRLMPTAQSAYRKFHSTETATARVYNDLLLATDRGQVSALCLLDLTAAFDTVDHELLLRRLECQSGLRGIPLMWFRSYLLGRTYRVIYAGSTSSTIYIVCSVPQGSVLGPLLFILYVADLADIVDRHGVSLHSFADDTQLYLHCHRDDTTMAVARLKECIADISHWMSANRLKLNTDKTELLWTGSRYNISQFQGHGPALELGADTVLPCGHVRLLGVTLSADLSLDRHVSVVCAKSFYWLRQLRRVRRSLDAESAATLVHAFVTSKVDYCNLLLAGSPTSVTDKLQRVMNAAARVVSGTKKYDRGLTQLLRSELHWLDVADRVTYKLSLMVFKCLHGRAPDYLSELCMPVAQVAERQHLRSASRHLLVVPRFQLHTYGRRAFAVAGPTTWNSLSVELRDPDLGVAAFGRSLKTFLFRRYSVH